MNNEFYDWFNEQSKHLSDTDKKLFMMWSSSAWNKQQERIDDLEKTLKQFYFTCDSDTILKVQAILEKSDE